MDSGPKATEKTNATRPSVLPLAPAGVLFDFDGVIVESYNFHLEAWRKVVGSLIHNEKVRLPPLAGKSTASIVELLTRIYGIQVSQEGLTELKHQYLADHACALQLIDGAKDCLDYVRNAKIPFAIASSSPSTYIRKTLEKVGLECEVVIGFDDVQLPKPDPETFVLAAHRIGIESCDFGKVICFDDSVHGVKAVDQAGMLAIGVTTRSAADTLSAAGAVLTCANLKEPVESAWLQPRI